MPDTKVIIEAVGYLGSALVLVSFLMASVVKLQVVNSIGSIIFATYALIIHSYPTAVMNICLVLINLYYLWKLRNSEPNYRLVSLNPSDAFVDFFLSEHRGDIVQCFPGRNWDQNELNRAYLVCHGDTPAGLMLGREADGELEIALDYSTPAYRDSSEGHYLVEHLPQEGLRLLRYEHAEEGHLPYLKKLGYTARNGAYELAL